MKSLIYYLTFSLWWLVSLLPWRVLYVVSDVVFYPTFRYVVRYRRRLVRESLSSCFPDRDRQELRAIERRFYHWLCDYLVELIKQASMTEADILRHMEFAGVDEAVAAFERSGHPLCVFYLAHYANWEWFTAITHFLSADAFRAQIYHPLHSQVFDRILLRQRSKCGTVNVKMNDTLRAILRAKRADQQIYMGFIADQSPKREAIHHWMPWLHHDTPVIVGAETIGRKVGAAYFYIDMEQVRRGYYRATIRHIDVPGNSVPAEGSVPADASVATATPYPVTEAYMQAVAASIERDPALWLWTHRRWKHQR